MSNDRVRTSGDGVIVEADALRRLREADPELVLVTDYLAGELDTKAARALERRLDRDPDFREKFGPLIAFWNAPLEPADLGLEASAIHALTVDEARQALPAADTVEGRAARWRRFCRAIGAPVVPWRETRRDRLRWWLRHAARPLLLFRRRTNSTLEEP